MHRIAGIFFFITLAAFSANAQTGKVLHKEVVRIINMIPKLDTNTHYLADEGKDSSIYSMIVTAIKTGQLSAYANDNTKFTTSLSYDSLKKTIKLPDSILVDNPIDNTKTMKTLGLHFEYLEINYYKILEEWSFDPKTGKTNIAIKGIGPLGKRREDKSFNERKPLFWLHYKDLQSIIKRYEQYHPDNTIAMHVWDDYFLSDIKPGVQK